MANPSSQITFPGQAISPNVPQSTNLQSGAVWYVPNGNFYLKMGPQSVLQWFDISSGLWRITDSGPSSHPIYCQSDGTNFRVMNISGTIQGVNITNAGTGYKTGDSFALTAPAAGTPSRTAKGTMIIGGSLSLTVTAGGTGYSNPIFLIQPPQLCGGTIGACLPAVIASCTLTAGVISSPSFTNGFAGAGYVSAPTVTVIDAVPTGVTPGSGAVITATVGGSGTWTGTVMTDYGAGYDGTHIPTFTFTTSAGSSAAATALPSMALKSVTVGGTNTGYSASVVIETSEGSGAAAIAPLNDEFVMPRPGRATATQSGNALQTPLIEDAGNGFQTVPLAKQVGNATADGSVNATFTAVVGGVNNLLYYWQVG